MKKKKLNLNEINVESFVTTLNENERNTVNGGITPVPGIISALIASYLKCKEVGEDLGDKLSKAAPGVCNTLAGYCTEKCSDGCPNSNSAPCHTDCGGYCSAPGRICA